jgi:hypothetical protein
VALDRLFGGGPLGPDDAAVVAQGQAQLLERAPEARGRLRGEPGQVGPGVFE